MKFHYSSIKPYEGSPIESSGGKGSRVEDRKSFSILSRKPTPWLEKHAAGAWGDGLVGWWRRGEYQMFSLALELMRAVVTQTTLSLLPEAVTSAVRNSAEDMGNLFCEPQSWRTDISGHLTDSLSNPKWSRADRGDFLTDVETVPWLFSEASGNNWQI